MPIIVQYTSEEFVQFNPLGRLAGAKSLGRELDTVVNLPRMFNPIDAIVKPVKCRRRCKISFRQRSLNSDARYDLDTGHCFDWKFRQFSHHDFGAELL